MVSTTPTKAKPLYGEDKSAIDVNPSMLLRNSGSLDGVTQAVAPKDCAFPSGLRLHYDVLDLAWRFLVRLFSRSYHFKQPPIHRLLIINPSNSFWAPLRLLCYSHPFLLPRQSIMRSRIEHLLTLVTSGVKLAVESIATFTIQRYTESVPRSVHNSVARAKQSDHQYTCGALMAR